MIKVFFLFTKVVLTSNKRPQRSNTYNKFSYPYSVSISTCLIPLQCFDLNLFDTPTVFRSQLRQLCVLNGLKIFYFISFQANTTKLMRYLKDCTPLGANDTIVYDNPYTIVSEVGTVSFSFV